MPPVPHPIDFDLKAGQHSVEIPGTKKDGQTCVYKSGVYDQSEITGPGEPKSLFNLFETTCNAFPDRTLFLRRALDPASTLSSPIYTTTLIPTTYAQTRARRDAFGSALLALEREGRLSTPDVPGVTPPEVTLEGVPRYGDENKLKGGARRGWAVGVWSKNREEWQVVDLACQAYGLVGVSLYETLGPDVAQYITNHCPLSIIVASHSHIPFLLKIALECPSLRVVVSMDDIPKKERTELAKQAAGVNVELLVMSEVEKRGAEEGIKLPPGPVSGVEGEKDLDEKRIVTVSYTSGTTGNPKGVVLTTQNVVSAVISNTKGIPSRFIGTEWTFLSFLPLSHIFEHFVELAVMYGAGTVAFACGGPLKFLEDAALLKPHFVVGVPRMFNRIHSAITGQMEGGGLKGALVSKAVNAKLENWRTTGSVHHMIYDALVFRKIRALLGGNVVFIGSGAAPLAKDVLETLKIAFSCDVIQSYGLTETVGTGCKTIASDTTATSCVGGLHPCCELKLIDHPDLGYTSNDKPNPRGEVCFRGLNVTPRYLHDPEGTAAAFDKDGFFKTGDVGEIDSLGRVKIIDRVKNLVKLSQGEYVALERLEGIYALDPIFASFLVHGDPARSHIIAIGVLDPAQASALVHHTLGETVGVEDVETLEDKVKHPEVRKSVLRSLGKKARDHKLNGFEMIKGLHLTLQPFPEHIVTPTFKIKRKLAAGHYVKEIEAVYARGDGEAVAAIQEARS
ncbi:hypothetical protein IAT38_007861 [Cryptococcus sp. DSM 104549]